jgi:CheY-like chemotaxis protein
MSEMNILLVDDDVAVNFLNKFILTDSGLKATISVAQHGQEALDVLQSTNICPDVIFLDINMPQLDGFGFLDRFRERVACFTSTKVYMLTSSVRESDREKAFTYSCVADYLEKPLTEEVVKKLFFN